MKNEYYEALDKIRDEVSFDDSEFRESKSSSNVDEELNTLQELVDKETSMKPKPQNPYLATEEKYYCPKCGELLGHGIIKSELFKYCSDCGQKLDWEEQQWD